MGDLRDALLLTESEVAERLGESRETVKRLRLSGRLAYIRGRPVLIAEPDLKAFIADRERRAEERRQAALERAKPRIKDARLWALEQVLFRRERLSVEKVLTSSKPSVRTAEPEQNASAYDWAAHHRRNSERAAERRRNDPNAYALLSHIRERGPSGIRELEALVPALGRHATVRLLQCYRAAGWLEVIGKARRAEWLATLKLMADMPEFSENARQGGSATPSRPEESR